MPFWPNIVISRKTVGVRTLKYIIHVISLPKVFPHDFVLFDWTHVLYGGILQVYYSALFTSVTHCFKYPQRKRSQLDSFSYVIKTGSSLQGNQVVYNGHGWLSVEHFSQTINSTKKSEHAYSLFSIKMVIQRTTLDHRWPLWEICFIESWSPIWCHIEDESPPVLSSCDFFPRDIWPKLTLLKKHPL